MGFFFKQYESMGCGLVGYPQDLLIGKEASVHWCEVEVGDHERDLAGDSPA